MLISREAAIPEVDGCSVAKAFTTWGEAVRVTCVDSPAHSIAGSEQGPITELNMTGTCEAFVALSRFKCLRNRVCPSSVRGRRSMQAGLGNRKALAADAVVDSVYTADRMQMVHTLSAAR